MTHEEIEAALKHMAYINQKCMQAKRAGVFDEVETTCLWNSLDAIHRVFMLEKFPFAKEEHAETNATP